MLEGLFVTPAVTAIVEALASARIEGKLAVIGNAKLAAALANGREVVAIGMSARAAKKLGVTLPDTSSLEAGSIAALIATDGWDGMPEWTRVVRDGGAIVMVDKGHAPDASRRALCGGLTEIEQRHAGRAIVTSGLVTHI